MFEHPLYFDVEPVVAVGADPVRPLAERLRLPRQPQIELHRSFAVPYGFAILHDEVEGTQRLPLFHDLQVMSQQAVTGVVLPVKPPETFVVNRSEEHTSELQSRENL